jgi:DNA polymerase-1
MSQRTVLIDGDILVYRAASAAEHEVEWCPDEWTLHAHAGPAKAWIADEVERIADTLKAPARVVVLSDTTNFRKELVSPTYKADRNGKRKPLLYTALRKFILEELDGFMRPGLEGDDVIGILATSKVIYPGDKIIVSQDKDFKTIPAKLYNDRTRTKKIVSEAEADFWFLIQTLTGDVTDGYPGCPGYGPKTAEKLLSGMTSLADGWERVVGAYTKAGLTEEDAITQARLARILRTSDYNFKEKKVILWEPPK